MTYSERVAPELQLQISVIVPVYNGGVNFGRCLRALAKCHPRPTEVIVVDDGSTDDSLQTSKQFDVKVIRNVSREGPARSRNAGARVAYSDILLFVDADVIAPPDCIGQVARYFSSNADRTVSRRMRHLACKFTDEFVRIR